MSFFNWLFDKSGEASGAAHHQPHAKQGATGRESLPVTQPQRLEPESGSRDAERKNKRHASREQLYTAIREAMIRTGILSASYKFKVLALDRQTNDFLVMIDLTRMVGDPASQPSQIEALIIQSAKVRYDIVVSAVYWRHNEVAAISKVAPPFAAAAIARPAHAARKGPVSHEPIQADEVAAFQQALLAASAHGPAAVPDKHVKVNSGLPFSTPFGDFEDTQVPGHASYPALSNTQYGELR